MPKNKKEGIIYGICMCIIMAYSMGLLNISIHNGSLNMEVFLTSLKIFPIIFIIAFALANLIVHKINNILLARFTNKNDSTNALILFNCFFIVTMMSLLMTIIGGILGGDHIIKVLKDFLLVWPRNFCVAFFLNILIAGPISRFVLKNIPSKNIELDDIGLENSTTI